MAGMKGTVEKLRTAEKLRAHCKWLLSIARTDEERREYQKMLAEQDAIITSLTARMLTLMRKREARRA